MSVVTVAVPQEAADPEEAQLMALANSVAFPQKVLGVARLDLAATRRELYRKMMITGCCFCFFWPVLMKMYGRAKQSQQLHVVTDQGVIIAHAEGNKKVYPFNELNQVMQLGPKILLVPYDTEKYGVADLIVEEPQAFFELMTEAFESFRDERTKKATLKRRADQNFEVLVTATDKESAQKLLLSPFATLPEILELARDTLGLEKTPVAAHINIGPAQVTVNKAGDLHEDDLVFVTSPSPSKSKAKPKPTPESN